MLSLMFKSRDRQPAQGTLSAAEAPPVAQDDTTNAPKRAPVSPFSSASVARERSALWAQQVTGKAPRPQQPAIKHPMPAPAARGRGRTFAKLVSDIRFGSGPTAGRQLSGRAALRFQSDPFVKRLARLS